ncbi:MAG: sirohydrochlorin cobaltochelatase [Lachnospiraceae bacterium]|nr:sirohydrochlorin cobaltochelatase [Lachnospiraceae bacterium]
MKKRFLSVLLAGVMTAALISGCGSKQENVQEPEAQESVQEPAEETQPEETVEEAQPQEKEEETSPSDEELAKNVADLIDSIYVQTWDADTDERCKQAKEAWDALSDEQKELVEGKFADPDYFGADTGDASKDDPLNSDSIGEKEILVVSFGTSFNDSRAKDIGGVEKSLQEAYPDWSVRRAFTAQIIINHVLARDNEKIDNVDQAFERAISNKVKELVIQPTHLMHGAEYDELMEAVEANKDKFEKIVVSEPLLGEVGSDAQVINDDKKAVAEAITKEAVTLSGFATIEDAEKGGVAFVFMGHGTAHTAKVSYSQMATQMDKLGYKNVFIGTVEGEPEETACENIINEVKKAGYKNVILRPLMVVAGDHANNDMAGDDEDSWKSMFEASGAFDSIDCQIEGLGRIEEVKKLYVAHTAEAMKSAGMSSDSSDENAEKATDIEDGEYEAEFATDNSMFHVNEVKNGMGTLIVKDGKMTIHIVMPSKNIVNLFSGMAADAQKDGAELIIPSTEDVTYDDGTTEEVFAFDVPVPYLDSEFDLALIGTKGVWYDHKVTVKAPK